METVCQTMNPADDRMRAYVHGRRVGLRGSSAAAIFWAVPTLCALLFAHGEARAEANPSIVFVPAAAGESGFLQMRAAAESLGSEMRARGRSVLSPETVTERFSRTHSAEPIPLQEGDLDAISRVARQAIVLVAAGKPREASELVSEILDRAQRSIESLNRETETARQVFDSCLYMVRALIEMGELESAQAEAVRCRRLAPDLAPARFQHPPDVVAMLRHVDHKLHGNPAGSLTVESSPDDCPLYLNGRRLGTTPRSIDGLPTGRYRVQAECRDSEAGRVHFVDLGKEPAKLHVDYRFDLAVVTHPVSGVGLRYPDAHMLNTKRVADGLVIARAVDAEQAWLMTPESETTMRIDRVDVGSGRVVASVRLAVSRSGLAFRHDPLPDAFEALLDGRSRDLTEHLAKPMETWQPSSDHGPTNADDTHDRASKWNYAIGGGLLLAGALTLISPVHTAANHGDLIGILDNGAREEVYFGTRSQVLMGVGIAAVLGGAAVLILRPLRVTPALGPKQAGLQVEGTF